LAAAVTTLHGARPEYEFTAEQLLRERTGVQFLWGGRDPFGGLDVARRGVAVIGMWESVSGMTVPRELVISRATDQQFWMSGRLF
jgi:hypothetical protein